MERDTRTCMIFNKVIQIFWNKLDIFLAFFGLIISFLFFLFGKSIIFFVFGILIFIPCSIWLIFNKKFFFSLNFTDSYLFFKLLLTCFFAIYSLNIFILYSRPNLYERPFLFIILLSMISGILVCEIFTSNRRHILLILSQIIILGICISWSQSLIFPEFIGLDDWYHSNIVKLILDTHFIPEMFTYSSFPILHLIIVSITLIANISIKLSSIFSVSFGEIICSTFFIYLLSSYLLKNYKIGLLSAFFMIIGNVHIRFSYLIYPNAFGLIFIIIILFLIFSNNSGKLKNIMKILTILFMVMIILTHPLVSIFMAFILFILAFFISFSYNENNTTSNKKISLILPVFFSVATFAYWTYLSLTTRTLADLISMGFSPDILARTTLDLGINIPYNFFDLLFSVIPFYLYVSIAIIGVFYFISQRNHVLIYLYGFLPLFPLIIPFIFYLFGMESITLRWFLLAQVLLCIPLSSIFYIIGGKLISKSFLYYAFIIVIIIIFSFLMINSELGNHDNFSLSPLSKIKIYHTESEIIGYNFIINKSTKILSVDGFSIPVLKYHYNWDNYYQMDKQYVSGNIIQDNSFKIIRQEMVMNFQRSGILSREIVPDINNFMLRSKFDKIYENSGLTIFN